MAIIELRTYIIKQGCRDAWVDLMETLVIPFQKDKGMTVLGSFTSLDQADTFVWIRRFDTEEQKKALFDAVYGSDAWINDIRPAMGDMLIREKIQVHHLEPTKGSPIQ